MCITDKKYSALHIYVKVFGHIFFLGGGGGGGEKSYIYKWNEYEWQVWVYLMFDTWKAFLLQILTFQEHLNDMNGVVIDSIDNNRATGMISFIYLNGYQILILWWCKKAQWGGEKIGIMSYTFSQLCRKASSRGQILQ